MVESAKGPNMQSGADTIGELFAASGKVGRDLSAVDWAATPIGLPSSWPQSLIRHIRMMMGSRFPMWMAWGPELTFFCNNAYRRNTLGNKYPWALGKPASDVWAEVWGEVGPLVEQAMSTGSATWDEGMLLLLERNGYLEETHHTFSYSPLTDDAARIVGMLCVVNEVTDQVIGERRMSILIELGSGLTKAESESDVLAAVDGRLGAEPRTFPFTLMYLFDDDASSAQLACSPGIKAAHAIAPPVIKMSEETPTWPVAAMAKGETVFIDELAPRFPSIPQGGLDKPPAQALGVPLLQRGHADPYGFLVFGLNPYLPFDAGYAGFLDLIAGQVGASITRARAFEFERVRTAELAELDRAKTAFFTNISHELRTPLTLLLGPAADALADEAVPLPASQRTRVEVMHRNAARLLKLVNVLLDFSRLEEGQADPKFEAIDLARFTADVASMFSSAVEQAGLTLAVDCPPFDDLVLVDPDMWTKIVSNLLSNALKATFAGSITIRLATRDGEAVLDVTDTGIGIEPKELDRLFERFHRVTGARSRSHEGSGIGLALTAELVNLHGGTIVAKSVPGEGTRFSVRVPFGAAHLPAEQIVQTRTHGVPSAARETEGFLAESSRWLDSEARSRSSDATFTVSTPPDVAVDRMRVLVVDDNIDMREYIVGFLADHYTVDTAPDGVVALEMARASPPDLVLTDVMVPGLDGFGLLAAMRSDPATMHVPVVMLSARAGDEATIEGLEAGADDYLTKPFTGRELLARIRSNLELDRVRRLATELEQQRTLLDQAQRMARVGSWEFDLASGSIAGSDEFFRQIQLDPTQVRSGGIARVIRRVHPDDVERMGAALSAATEGEVINFEVRVRTLEGEERTYHTVGEMVSDADGVPILLRGSIQDVTDRIRAKEAADLAAAEKEAAARESLIAEELQRSLLPERTFAPQQLRVATHYQAGVDNTRVGGDWFDVIELDRGRTALVVGDVMGRGVRAAAVMGQLRATIRAYAQLDLSPARVLDYLDATIRDISEEKIATCVYAVFDPEDRSLVYANAGHLPPLVRSLDGTVRQLGGTFGPPLGTGPHDLVETRLALSAGDVLTLYTDGLVEQRGNDIEDGIRDLETVLDANHGRVEDLPLALVEALLPHGSDDDVAVLVAEVPSDDLQTGFVVLAVPPVAESVGGVRRFAHNTLTGWAIPPPVVGDLVLVVSELVTNAIRHSRSPIELRLSRTSDRIVIAVHDGTTAVPRRLQPNLDAEHGRGLQLVSAISDQWGVRPTEHGKSVWSEVFVDMAAGT
jgi:signal transduction histidine kinase/DNA-binding response OmpR family regulator